MDPDNRGNPLMKNKTVPDDTDIEPPAHLFRQDSGASLEIEETTCCGMYETIRASVKTTFEDPESSASARAVQCTVITMISCSIVCILSETVPEWEEANQQRFSVLEVLFTCFFTVELIIRIWIHEGSLNLEKGVGFVLDVLATLPWYADQFLRRMFSVQTSLAFTQETDAFQVLRLLRVLRVLKAARHSQTIATIMHCVLSTADGLLALLAFISMGTVLAATAVFFVEHEVPESPFVSIPAALWWALPTITGVGYGDMTPETIWGRILGALTMVLGVLITSLVGTIMTGPVLELYQKNMQRLRMKKRSSLDLGAAEILIGGCDYTNISEKRRSTLRKSATRINVDANNIISELVHLHDLVEHKMGELVGSLQGASVDDAKLNQANLGAVASLVHLEKMQKALFKEVKSVVDDEAVIQFISKVEEDG